MKADPSRMGGPTPGQRGQLGRWIPIGLFLLWGVQAPAVLALQDVICTGDCNYDRSATVDELLTGVNIALGRQAVEACAGFDLSGDQRVTIDELLGGVRNALDGCPAARFVPAACDFTLPDGQTPETVACGHLIAREDRSRNDGRTVRLAVAVLKATGETPASDPLVFLSGGPGQDSLGAGMQAYTAEFAAPLQSKRDLVRFDQRGTGRSQPKLDCPEYVAAVRAAYAVSATVEEETAQTLAALRVCRDRLVGEGVNLSAYTSADSAADLQDLMIGLGYERWNIDGISYGTLLALTAMRDTPEHIRSVVLDSSAAVQANHVANWAANFEHALNRLFAGCAADPACDAAYPNLEETFYALVQQLDGAPVTLRPVDAVTGEPFEVVLTGARLLYAIQQALYRTDSIPFLPLVIADAAAGNYALLTSGYGSSFSPGLLAWGMHYSVRCGEEVPFITPEVLAQATEGVRPEIVHVGLALVTQFNLDVCEFWGVPPPAAIENEAVVSDIPTLILAGEYDPATPPYNGEQVAQTLSRSHFFEFRGFGHSLLRAQSAETARPRCAMQLVSAFLDDPLTEPDGSCVENLEPPRFVAVAMPTATPTATPSATETSTPDLSFYEPPEPLPGNSPGDLIRFESIEPLARGSRAWRILYRSESVGGEPIAVSGLVVAPEGPPPAGGRPVVSWAHGTVGVSDGCAPSRGFRVPLNDSFTHDFYAIAPEIVAAGWVGVATDYEGLGTPGVHPYLVGESEGRATLDIVRAAAQIEAAGAGRRAVVWGRSQGGHAALFAGEIAPQWAPELDLLGVVAAAPASNFEAWLLRPPVVPVSAYGYVWEHTVGFEAAYGDLALDEIYSPAALTALRDALEAGLCSRELRERAAEFPNAGVVVPELPDEPWRELARINSPGNVGSAMPVLLLQGDADTQVLKVFSDILVAGLCGLGTEVEYRVFAGEGHQDSTARHMPEILAWTAARIAGAPAVTTCP